MGGLNLRQTMRLDQTEWVTSAFTAVEKPRAQDPQDLGFFSPSPAKNLIGGRALPHSHYLKRMCMYGCMCVYMCKHASSRCHITVTNIKLSNRNDLQETLSGSHGNKANKTRQQVPGLWFGGC